MRLIDADALKKAIIELNLDNSSHWSVIYKIDNAPTPKMMFNTLSRKVTKLVMKWQRRSLKDRKASGSFSALGTINTLVVPYAKMNIQANILI